MTEQRGDEGFSVTPRRIGDAGPGGSGGRRRRSLGLALVVVAAAAIFGVSWLGPRLTDRPNFDVSFFATPTPDATPTATPTRTFPTLTGATPLPAVTRPEGPVPTGRIAVQTGDLRIIDLATGEIVTGPRAIAGRDAVFRTPGGDGWTCVCFDDGDLSGRTERTLRIDVIDPSGAAVSKVLGGFRRAPSQTDRSDVATDVDLVIGGGRNRGLVAIATRDDGGPYRMSVVPIDVDAGTIGRSVELGTSGPPPRPSAGPGLEGGLDLYLDGPHVRISPDGRVAFIWGSIQRFDGSGEVSTDIRAWRVELAGDGSIGPVSVANGLLDLPRFCSSVGFAASDRLAWICPQFGADAGGDGTWEVGTVGLDGESRGRNVLTAVNPNSYLESLLDRANGQIYAWDPVFQTISRIDARTLVATGQTFDPLVETAPGLAGGGGTLPADWRRADSAVAGVAGTLTGSLDGERLYALGFDPEPALDSGNQSSRGVDVIDRRTLALVDRWAPATDYVGVTALPGGYVAAAGLPGVREDGHFAPWEASLTIHDAADGRILVRFGQLGADSPVAVVDR